jgi:hypothetical protein
LGSKTRRVISKASHVRRPALELVAPHLRPRAVAVCDNTGREDERAAYADYFAFINDPAQHFRTMTLPFSGGLEMSVRLD